MENQELNSRELWDWINSEIINSVLIADELETRDVDKGRRKLSVKCDDASSAVPQSQKRAVKKLFNKFLRKKRKILSVMKAQ